MSTSSSGNVAGATIACVFCSNPPFSSPSHKLLLDHIRLVHSPDPNFSVQCSHDGCCRTFKNFRTFQNHLLAHRPHQDTSTAYVDVTGGTTEDQEAYVSVLESTQERRDILKDYVAKWILKTSETRSLTRQASIGIVEDTSFLVEQIVQFLQMKTIDSLQCNDDLSKQALISRVKELFASPTTKPFDGLLSFHHQISYYRANFNLIEPKKVILKRSSVLRRYGRRTKKVVKTVEAVYISLLDTLQALLNNDSVVKEVDTSHQLTSPMLGDYCDGEEFCQHSLFSVDSTALQIILYYDELELCNPLGAHRKKHKIGAFYYTLGNIRPQFRSKIHTIQLLELVPYHAVAEFGIDAVMEPIRRDLQTLETEEGVLFTVGGKERRFRAAVTVVTADNPASSAMSGFKQSAAAFRPCRQCMGCDVDIQTKFCETNFKLRSIADHKLHCQLVENEALSTAEKEHFSKVYGVNRSALLNELKFVDVTSGMFIPDIMHDILEGALPLEMKLMLKVFVHTDKFLTVKMIDDSFKNLNLFSFDGDVPSPLAGISLLANDGNLRQHAMQMWTLGRYLPLAIGHLIPLENENWVNFLRLLEIMDIIFARRLPADECVYLESLIVDHHSNFKDLYPEATITLKMHSMVHMPRLCRKFGPLINHWTTRFEAKHNLRHQLRQCYQSLDLSILPNENVEIGPGCEVQCTNVRMWRESANPSSTAMFKANWVRVNGTYYSTPFSVVIGLNDDEELQFGNVVSIFVKEKYTFFEFIPMVTIDFNTHTHSYLLKSPSTMHTFYIRQSDLCDYHPYGMYNIRGKKHVVTRYQVFL